jgi:hypothetical protein
VKTRISNTRLSARGAVAIAFSAIAGVLAVASIAWACTVVAGSTWYSDGTRVKQGPPGTQITARATGAMTGIPYHLVIGDMGTEPGHSTHACMRTLQVINPAILFAGPSGLIGNVTGTVTYSVPGTYQLCFKDSSPNNSTGTGGASFTVL